MSEPRLRNRFLALNTAPLGAEARRWLADQASDPSAHGLVLTYASDPRRLRLATWALVGAVFDAYAAAVATYAPRAEGEETPPTPIPKPLHAGASWVRCDGAALGDTVGAGVRVLHIDRIPDALLDAQLLRLIQRGSESRLVVLPLLAATARDAIDALLAAASAHDFAWLPSLHRATLAL